MMKLKTLQTLALMGLSVSLIGALLGCEGEPPVSEKTKQQSNRLAEIRQRTGFDWNKATDDDKQFLKEACNGDEGCAKQLLYRPKPGQRPGGPNGGPNGGPGGGPPPAVGG